MHAQGAAVLVLSDYLRQVQSGMVSAESVEGRERLEDLCMDDMQPDLDLARSCGVGKVLGMRVSCKLQRGRLCERTYLAHDIPAKTYYAWKLGISKC